MAHEIAHLLSLKHRTTFGKPGDWDFMRKPDSRNLMHAGAADVNLDLDLAQMIAMRVNKAAQ